jgi:hypothetical protein
MPRRPGRGRNVSVIDDPSSSSRVIRDAVGGHGIRREPGDQVQDPRQIDA